MAQQSNRSPSPAGQKSSWRRSRTAGRELIPSPYACPLYIPCPYIYCPRSPFMCCIGTYMHTPTNPYAALVRSSPCAGRVQPLTLTFGHNGASSCTLLDTHTPWSSINASKLQAMRCSVFFFRSVSEAMIWMHASACGIVTSDPFIQAKITAAMFVRPHWGLIQPVLNENQNFRFCEPSKSQIQTNGAPKLNA